jgi:hypothetical protein
LVGSGGELAIDAADRFMFRDVETSHILGKMAPGGLIWEHVLKSDQQIFHDLRNGNRSGHSVPPSRRRIVSDGGEHTPAEPSAQNLKNFRINGPFWYS